METVEQIVNDTAIAAAWGNANFGAVDKRELIANTLLKCASGFQTGHTAKSIVHDLGLVTAKWTLSVKGKKYLWAAYSKGVSL